MSKEPAANANLSHYRILQKLGAGGMGKVYLAKDTNLDRKVALKILPSESAGDKERMSRFVREAKAASALNHPSIITIYEIGEIDSTHFIAAEYIQGETLHTRLKRHPLTLKNALEIAIQVASALDAAHRAGIIHRDIKPANLMIRTDGLVKILDFGIAKLLPQKIECIDTEAATAIKPPSTNPGVVIGTAYYMSPEQARGKDVDARSDIFSLGVVLYEMLAGKPPFEGENTIDVIGSILNKEPSPLSRHASEIPHELERITNKALKKDREERYQMVKDLLLDLKDVKQELEFQDKLKLTSSLNRENVNGSPAAPENTRFIYEFGKFVLDPHEKTLFVEGVPVHLPAKEFETLLLLVENNGRALSKEEMMQAIWQDAFVEETNLFHQISQLRKLLNTNGKKLIETLPKHGYRFSADVNQIFQPAGETILEKRTVKQLTVKLEENPEAPPRLLPDVKKKIPLPAIFGVALILLAVVSAIWFWGSKTPARINSIAVLPLRPLTEGENIKSLGLALTDTLIMKIGGLRQIKVRPISAVTQYTDAPQDSLEIGRRLKVDAVLEGTIQQADGRVRINVRLLRVKGGEQIWAGNFEEESTKVFDLQDRLTAQTAQALKLKLGASETKQIKKHFTKNPEALDAYQKAQYFSNRRTVGDLKTAIGYFNEAVGKDPNYALAYSGLADAYSLLADYDGALPKDAYPKAKDAAMKALELDAELAEAHTSLAYIKTFYYHDWQGAQVGFLRSIALNPNYATAHHWYSEYLMALGRFDEAFIEAHRAKEIDPLSPSINAQEVWILFHARRYNEAIERGRRIAEMNPDYAEIHDPLKRCYEQKGMYSEAIAARQKRRRLAGWDATETAALREAASTSDSAVYWNKRLEQEIEDARNEPPMPFEMALIYAQLGEKDAAFEYLDKAIENRNYPVVFLKVTPDIDPLRADARFADALLRVGLLF